jgi:hypothetical protein
MPGFFVVINSYCPKGTEQEVKMADFFKDEPPQEEVVEEVAEPEKIKVGEEEFTQEELSSLVGLGKLGREMEEKYNTKIDRVWPEYTKTTQELKALKEEKERLEAERVSQKANTGAELTDEEVAKQAREQARKIGLALSEDVETKVSQKVMEVLAARDLLNDCKDFEGELNGKDGRPAFKTQEVLKHMDETGIKNPEKAYKDLYEKELDAWKEQQIKKAKPSGLVTEGASAAGGKEPREVKPTAENLDQLVRDALAGNI